MNWFLLTVFVAFLPGCWVTCRALWSGERLDVMDRALLTCFVIAGIMMFFEDVVKGFVR